VGVGVGGWGGAGDYEHGTKQGSENERHLMKAPGRAQCSTVRTGTDTGCDRSAHAPGAALPETPDPPVLARTSQCRTGFTHPAAPFCCSPHGEGSPRPRTPQPRPGGRCGKMCYFATFTVLSSGVLTRRGAWRAREHAPGPELGQKAQKSEGGSLADHRGRAGGARGERRWWWWWWWWWWSWWWGGG
jgi:hypothetical protein